MKTLTALPVLVTAVDDTSTLLSLKMHSNLETGVDHLLDAVGSRNVTQMSSLIQNLVEETISAGVMELDTDVHKALELIKTELLSDIRGSLNEAHCWDQSALHNAQFCFEKCENITAPCGEPCDGQKHRHCRDTLFTYYKDHIEKCRALDDFSVECDKFDKGCCYLPHTTWNCEGPCESTIKGLHVNDDVGKWMEKQISKFKSAYDQWTSLYEECRLSYRTFIEKDAECDCLQAECESTNCKWDSCEWTVCNHDYQKCWAACEAASAGLWCRTECLEKDRKIDWSATEKIECYVNVMLEQPTTKELLDLCGKEDCYNEYRTKMYMKCNEICPEVDYEEEGLKSLKDEHGECRKYDEMVEIMHSWDDHKRRGASAGKVSGKKTDVSDHKDNVQDQDVTDEGRYSVRTRHRAHAGDEMRCTSHLDIDWVLPPCCHPCPELPSIPCEGGGDYSGGWDETKYMWIHYGRYSFLDTDQIWGMENYVKCHEAAGEHTYAYAYNLCPCIECPAKTPPCTIACTEAKACKEGCDYDYDYHKHNVVANCDAEDYQMKIPKDTVDPWGKPRDEN